MHMAKASRSRDDDARALAASAAARGAWAAPARGPGPGAWAAPEPGASPGSSIALTWDRSHGLHMIVPTPAKQVRPSRIPSLCTRSTRAGIEWRCCHRAVCMAQPR